MERSDERLSTRDLASGGGGDAEADRADAERTDERVDPVGEGGAVATDEATTRDSRYSYDETTPDAPEAAGDTAAGDRAADTGDTGDTGATSADAGRDTGAGAGTTADSDAGPLVSDPEGFQRQWEQVQGRFVDEPRGAVEDADALVATVMQQVADGFASERERLEAHWGRGEDISTEDLRVSLQRYRSFFQRLLSS
jgi:hypothetical protein